MIWKKRVARSEKRVAVVLLAAFCFALPVFSQDAAPDREFERVAEHVSRDAPSQDLVDRIYEFMERYPKDPRSDRLQYWVGVIQQKRKFHNEAIKELGFLVSDFPKSPLLLAAIRAQAESYQAIGKPKEAADCYATILKQRPANLAENREAALAVREALMFLAREALAKKDVDAAIGYFLQLPDRTEAITRVVELYISADRHEDALAAIAKLDEEDRFLAYRLTAMTYASRPGSANLMALLSRVIEKEKPAARVDNLIEGIVKVLAKKDADGHEKALNLVASKYDRLKRWAHFALCELHKSDDPQRLRTFIGDYRTGQDVEKCKTYLGAYYEVAGDVKRAQEAYWLLDDQVGAHFLVAETYYGKLAKNKDYVAGAAELTTIVKRFYSPASAAEALTRRAELEATAMKLTDKAIKTLLELIDRFPNEGTYAQAALMRLGALYRSLKKQDDAIAAYEKLIIAYPNGNYLRPAWLNIAYCHEEKQNPKAAIDVFKSVMRKYPRTAEASTAHTRLEQVYKIADTDVSDR